jgi:hypothetical protein
MLAFTLLVGVLAVLRLITYKASAGRKTFVVLTSGLLWLLLSLRNLEFGSDVAGYVRAYRALENFEMGNLYGGALGVYSKDPTFWVIAKMFHSVGASPRVWIAVISGLLCLALGRLIYRYSPHPFLSFTIAISLDLLFVSVSGLRQSVAISFILLAYPSLRDRRLARFVLLVLVGSLFHSSALVFLLAYPIAWMALGWGQAAVLLLGIASSVVLEPLARQLILAIGWTENLVEYSSSTVALTWAGFAVNGVIAAFWLWRWKRLPSKDPADITFFNIMVLGLAFLAFSTVIAESFRLALYFTAFSCVSIPRVVGTGLQSRERALVYGFVLVGTLTYFSYTARYTGFSLIT